MLGSRLATPRALPPPTPTPPPTPPAPAGRQASSIAPQRPSSLAQRPPSPGAPKNSAPSASPSRSFTRCSATVCTAGRPSVHRQARVAASTVPTGRARRTVARARLPASLCVSEGDTVACSTAVKRARNMGLMGTPPMPGSEGLAALVVLALAALALPPPVSRA